jgi:hypothetical protein
MDLGRLRNVLRRLVLGLKERGTHRELPEISRQLGLPELPDTGSKSERLAAVFDAVPDADLPSVAERYLAICPPPPGDRNTIQELIWPILAPQSRNGPGGKSLARWHLRISTQIGNASTISCIAFGWWTLTPPPRLLGGRSNHR